MYYRHDNYEEYSNPYGQIFLLNVLTKLWEVEQRESIRLHREINVIGLKDYPIPIGESVTRPKDDYFVSSVDKNDPSKFIVKLRHLPSEKMQVDQDLDYNKSLKVYHQFTTANGFEFSPHRYPLEIRRKMNKFLHPGTQLFGETCNVCNT